MKVDSISIADVFSNGGNTHYILPHFQREYTWEKEHWDTLLSDLFAIYDEYRIEQEPEHFLGSLVVIDGGKKHGTVPVFVLVDGQQRLITLSLILRALQEITQESAPELGDSIRSMLVNKQSGDVHYKLLPTTKYGDRTAYTTLIEGQRDVNSKSNVLRAYGYIHKELLSRLSSKQIDVERLFIVLSNCFQVVFINLDRGESPYKIFESLNAKGKRLTQADLVRNYIAMKLPVDKQELVFDHQWSPIETMLRENEKVGRLGEMTAFLRHYLAMRTGTLCNEEHVYARFRDRIEGDFREPSSFIEELSTLRQFARHYNNLLRPENEANTTIRQSLERLKTLQMSTAYPFILRAYDAYLAQSLDANEFAEILQTLENYAVRRLLCNRQTSYVTKMFPTLWDEIDLDRVPESLKERLATKQYPSDSEVRLAIHDSNMYTRGTDRVSLILGAVNRFLSIGTGAYTVLDAAPTLEHILPQTKNDSWENELGRTFRKSMMTMSILLATLRL